MRRIEKKEVERGFKNIGKVIGIALFIRNVSWNI